jgi:hypothetical protein
VIIVTGIQVTVNHLIANAVKLSHHIAGGNG